MKVRYLISEKWSKEWIFNTIEAIEFAIKYYKLENDKATLTVKLQSGDPEESEADAARLKNHRYEVRINKSRVDENVLLNAIFHEMTHVKQFVKDQFIPTNNIVRWKGETFKMESPEEYYLSPWEMEARAMEEALIYFYDQSI